MRAILQHRGQMQDITSCNWLEVFCARGFSAGIFDCDGTLAESAEAHMRAIQRAALKQGHEMAADWYLGRTGIDRKNLFRAFREEMGVSFDVDRACRDSMAYYGAYIDLVRPIERTLSFLATLKKHQIPVAVATNAERPVVQQTLSAVGAWSSFDVIVTASDGLPPKPSPRMFLHAAAQLHRTAEETLVVEDSPQGVSAAKNAGMGVLQIVSAEHSDDPMIRQSRIGF